MLNANPHATDEDINKAIAAIGATDFVDKLPQGIDTVIGTGGNKLSGGQKQRLAIARAIIKNPELLIFDEATSALDTDSEKKVQVALEEVLKMEMTKVVIAHRLSTIKNADKIILIQDGVIEGEGTHETMMKTNKLYASLVTIQEEAQRTYETSMTQRKSSSDPPKKETNEEDRDNESVDTDSENQQLLPVINPNDINHQNEQLDVTSEKAELSTIEILSRLIAYNNPVSYIWVLMFGLIFIPTASCLLIILQLEIIVHYIYEDTDTLKTKMRIFLPCILAA